MSLQKEKREKIGHKDIWGKCHVMTGRDWNDTSIGQGTPRITSTHQKLGGKKKVRKDIPLETLKRAWPCQHSDFGHPASRTVRGQVCCFKLPSVRYFVTAALGNEYNHTERKRAQPIFSSIWNEVIIIKKCPHIAGTGVYRVPGPDFRTKVPIVPFRNGGYCGPIDTSFPGNCPEKKLPALMPCPAPWTTVSNYWLMPGYRDRLSHLSISLQGCPCFWEPHGVYLKPLL